MSRKISFFSSSDEFEAAQNRFLEISSHLRRWPLLSEALEKRDETLFQRAMEDLPYTDYCMVVQLFRLSHEAQLSMGKRYDEMNEKYRSYVRELNLKTILSDLVLAIESPLLLFGTAVVGGVCALSIALGKEGQLIPFVSDSSLITVVLSFSGGVLGASVFSVLQRRKVATQKVQELKNLLARDPGLYETYGACMMDSKMNPRTTAKIFALMKEK